MWLAAGLAALLVLLALLGSFWAGAWQLAQGRDAAAALVAEARGEAEAIRAAGAGEIAAVRAEVDAAIEAARAEAAKRYDADLDALDEVGVALAAAQAEHATVEAELQTFITLRKEMGFRMARHFNSRPVIIVPEGKEIRAWDAPGPSELAGYNG